MTVIPVHAQVKPEESAIPLAWYAQFIQYEECAFWGVNRGTQTPYGCREIWRKSERDLIDRYLGEAQVELENVLNFKLAETWTAGEKRAYTFPLLTQWNRVIQAGVKATTVISADEAVDHTADPAVIGPVVTTVTDPDEIRLFYPASLVGDDVDAEISPSAIDLDTGAGTVTIQVPRCRLVHPDLVDNPRTGLDYAVLANFLAIVDVRRVYNDQGTHATLIWPHSCTTSGNGSCACSCGEYTQDACIYVAQERIGRLDVLPASYSGGAWARASAQCCGVPEWVTLNYQSGVKLFGADRWWRAEQAIDAVVRLAHSKMPDEPCACEIVRYLWDRDRQMPDPTSRERLNCPFGLSNGAWAAWRFAQTLKVQRSGVL